MSPVARRYFKWVIDGMWDTHTHMQTSALNGSYVNISAVPVMTAIASPIISSRYAVTPMVVAPVFTVTFSQQIVLSTEVFTIAITSTPNLTASDTDNGE
jgi:hypothetical protein